MYKVMIVDDEPWSRKVIKQLGQWDTLQLTIVGEAEDGTEGLRLIEELQPDIVVTDMRMPGIDGVELLKALKERHPSLKIIVMSGYDDFVYLKQAIHSQAKDYLLKPVDPDELHAALAQCVRELQQTKQILASTRNTPLLLADSILLDQYLEYRHLIYGYLLDLNALGVSQTLNALQHFLDSEHFESSRLKEIGHDFMQLLESFVTTSELEEQWDQWIDEHEPKLPEENLWPSVNEMIGRIERLYKQAIGDLQEARKKRNKLDMSEILTYINRHYKETITLESLADYFYISKEHLSRSFKTFSGETVMDYIIRKRMEKAKQLIVEHKLSIKHAAEMTGYMDVAYFYRVFKKHYGFAPGELRNGRE
jgi:two-component system response regulator YesN